MVPKLTLVQLRAPLLLCRTLQHLWDTAVRSAAWGTFFSLCLSFYPGLPLCFSSLNYHEGSNICGSSLLGERDPGVCRAWRTHGFCIGATGMRQAKLFWLIYIFYRLLCVCCRNTKNMSHVTPKDTKMKDNLVLLPGRMMRFLGVCEGGNSSRSY